MPRGIKDQFSDLPVSRERKRQLRLIRNGRCWRCGRPALVGLQCHWHAARKPWKAVRVPHIKGTPRPDRKAWMRKAVNKIHRPDNQLPVITEMPLWMRQVRVRGAHALD